MKLRFISNMINKRNNFASKRNPFKYKNLYVKSMSLLHMISQNVYTAETFCSIASVLTYLETKKSFRGNQAY